MLFTKKKNDNNNEEKETTDNSSSSSFINGSIDDQTTPTLSNTAKKLNVDNGGFPTLPALQGDHDDGDEDSVAAMSDIEDHISLDRSFESYVSDDDYYKQDYYDNTVQQQVDRDNNASSSVATSQAVIGEGMDADHQSSTAVNAAKDNNGDDNNDITANIKQTQFASPGRKSPEINNNNKTPPPSSIRLTSPSKHTTPDSKVTFAHNDDDDDDDDKSFNSNLKTPPHLNRIDVFATPDKNNNNSSVGSPITPLEQLQTPGGSTNAPRILKQNTKLRASRKELLKLLGSTAKQYSTYEEIASQKIFELEGRIRSLEKELQQQQQTTTTDPIRKDDDVDAKEDSITDESNNINHPKEISLEGWAERESYDPETVRNLSSSIMEKEKQLYMKEKFISSLKLRCETLKHCLTETGDALEQSKLAWEEERKKLVDKLGANSPMRLEHGTIMSLKMENTHLKKELDSALNDVDMLSDALEKNNEALDHSVSQLERLRKWKIEHDQMEDMRVVSESMQSVEEEKFKDNDGEESDSKQQRQQQQQHLQQQQLLQELEMKREEMRKGLEATISEKEQQIGMMEENLKEKSLEIIQLQTDLESCFKEIEGLKELVNKTAAAKGYEDFQSMVENLRDNATKSEIKATAFNERISELESELQEKKTEIVQLSMSHSNEDGETEEGESVYEAPPSETNHLNQCSSDGMEGTSMNFSPGAENSPSNLASNPLGTPSPTESRRGSGLSFLRTKFKEGRQYAAAVGNAGDPETMMGMIRERDQKINALEATIEPNILMTEKLKKDIERMDTEHQEVMLQSKLKIEQLEEENALYLQQVEGFERAFMTLNESQQSSLLPKLDRDEEANTPEESVESDKDDAASDEDEEPEDLKLQNAKLERIVSQLRDESSFQEDQIEKLKTELITLRVVSQQEKDSALDKLRDENKIVVAQRSALENQLIEINQSAAQIRDSLAHDASQSSATNGVEGDKGDKSGSDPILVAQVVMLKNANKVLESSVDSLRSNQQEKLAPLLEQIALLEEEKRIMAEEMHTKIHCREQTISNLEESLKQATRSRLDKNKKNSALKLSEQLLARATRAAKD